MFDRALFLERAKVSAVHHRLRWEEKNVNAATFTPQSRSRAAKVTRLRAQKHQRTPSSPSVTDNYSIFTKREVQHVDTKTEAGCVGCDKCHPVVFYFFLHCDKAVKQMWEQTLGKHNNLPSIICSIFCSTILDRWEKSSKSNQKHKAGRCPFKSSLRPPDFQPERRFTGQCEVKLISPAAGKDERRSTEPQHWNVLDQLRLDSLFKTARVWDLGFMNSVNVLLKKKKKKKIWLILVPSVLL